MGVKGQGQGEGDHHPYPPQARGHMSWQGREPASAPSVTSRQPHSRGLYGLRMASSDNRHVHHSAWQYDDAEQTTPKTLAVAGDEREKTDTPKPCRSDNSNDGQDPDGDTSLPSDPRLSRRSASKTHKSIGQEGVCNGEEKDDLMTEPGIVQKNDEASSLRSVSIEARQVESEDIDDENSKDSMQEKDLLRKSDTDTSHRDSETRSYTRVTAASLVWKIRSSYVTCPDSEVVKVDDRLKGNTVEPQENKSADNGPEIGSVKPEGKKLVPRGSDFPTSGCEDSRSPAWEGKTDVDIKFADRCEEEAMEGRKPHLKRATSADFSVPAQAFTAFVNSLVAKVLVQTKSHINTLVKKAADGQSEDSIQGILQGLGILWEGAEDQFQEALRDTFTKMLGLPSLEENACQAGPVKSWFPQTDGQNLSASHAGKGTQAGKKQKALNKLCLLSKKNCLNNTVVSLVYKILTQPDSLNHLQNTHSNHYRNLDMTDHFQESYSSVELDSLLKMKHNKSSDTSIHSNCTLHDVYNPGSMITDQAQHMAERYSLSFAEYRMPEENSFYDFQSTFNSYIKTLSRTLSKDADVAFTERGAVESDPVFSVKMKNIPGSEDHHPAADVNTTFPNVMEKADTEESEKTADADSQAGKTEVDKPVNLTGAENQAEKEEIGASEKPTTIKNRKSRKKRNSRQSERTKTNTRKMNQERQARQMHSQATTMSSDSDKTDSLSPVPTAPVSVPPDKQQKMCTQQCAISIGRQSVDLGPDPDPLNGVPTMGCGQEQLEKEETADTEFGVMTIKSEGEHINLGTPYAVNKNQRKGQAETQGQDSGSKKCTVSVRKTSSYKGKTNLRKEVNFSSKKYLATGSPPVISAVSTCDGHCTFQSQDADRCFMTLWRSEKPALPRINPDDPLVLPKGLDVQHSPVSVRTASDSGSQGRGSQQGSSSGSQGGGGRPGQGSGKRHNSLKSSSGGGSSAGGDDGDDDDNNNGRKPPFKGASDPAGDIPHESKKKEEKMVPPRNYKRHRKKEHGAISNEQMCNCLGQAGLGVHALRQSSRAGELDRCVTLCLHDMTSVTSPTMEDLLCCTCAVLHSLLSHFASSAHLPACHLCTQMFTLIHFHVLECQSHSRDVSEGEMVLNVCHKLQLARLFDDPVVTPDSGKVWLKVQKYLRAALSPILLVDCKAVEMDFEEELAPESQYQQPGSGQKPSAGDAASESSIGGLHLHDSSSSVHPTPTVHPIPKPASHDVHAPATLGQHIAGMQAPAVMPKTQLSRRPSQRRSTSSTIRPIPEEPASLPPASTGPSEHQQGEEQTAGPDILPADLLPEDVPHIPSPGTSGSEDIMLYIQKFAEQNTGEQGRRRPSHGYSDDPYETQKIYGKSDGVIISMPEPRPRPLIVGEQHLSMEMKPKGMPGIGEVVYGTRKLLLEVARNWRIERDECRATGRCRYQHHEEGVILAPFKQKLRILHTRYSKHHQWERLVHLGNGVTGKCHLCIDRTSNFKFCCKKMHILSYEDHELDIWSELQHPNIVCFYGAIRHGEKIYMFAEFIDGGSLAVLIKEQWAVGRRLSHWMALNYFRQILNTLSYLQTKGVLHEDIKADNLLLRQGTTEIILADFGVAQRICHDHAPRGRSPTGAPAHWAPEKASCEGHGFPSDLWAAACVLIHMLSGKPPWISRFPDAAILNFIIWSKPAPVDDIPENVKEDMRNLITCCLVKDSAIRPTAKQILQHRAFQLLDQTGSLYSTFLPQLPVPAPTGPPNADLFAPQGSEEEAVGGVEVSSSDSVFVSTVSRLQVQEVPPCTVSSSCSSGAVSQGAYPQDATEYKEQVLSSTISQTRVEVSQATYSTHLKQTDNDSRMSQYSTTDQRGTNNDDRGSTGPASLPVNLKVSSHARQAIFDESKIGQSGRRQSGKTGEPSRRQGSEAEQYGKNQSTGSAPASLQHTAQGAATQISPTQMSSDSGASAKSSTARSITTTPPVSHCDQEKHQDSWGFRHFEQGQDHFDGSCRQEQTVLEPYGSNMDSSSLPSSVDFPVLTTPEVNQQTDPLTAQKSLASGASVSAGFCITNTTASPARKFGMSARPGHSAYSQPSSLPVHNCQLLKLPATEFGPRASLSSPQSLDLSQTQAGSQARQADARQCKQAAALLPTPEGAQPVASQQEGAVCPSVSMCKFSPSDVERATTRETLNTSSNVCGHSQMSKVGMTGMRSASMATASMANKASPHMASAASASLAYNAYSGKHSHCSGPIGPTTVTVTASSGPGYVPISLTSSPGQATSTTCAHAGTAGHEHSETLTANVNQAGSQAPIIAITGAVSGHGNGNASADDQQDLVYSSSQAYPEYPSLTIEDFQISAERLGLSVIPEEGETSVSLPGSSSVDSSDMHAWQYCQDQLEGASGYEGDLTQLFPQDGQWRPQLQLYKPETSSNFGPANGEHLPKLEELLHTSSISDSAAALLFPNHFSPSSEEKTIPAGQCPDLTGSSIKQSEGSLSSGSRARQTTTNASNSSPSTQRPETSSAATSALNPTTPAHPTSQQRSNPKLESALDVPDRSQPLVKPKSAATHTLTTAEDDHISSGDLFGSGPEHSPEFRIAAAHREENIDSSINPPSDKSTSSYISSVTLKSSSALQSQENKITTTVSAQNLQEPGYISSNSSAQDTQSQEQLPPPSVSCGSVSPSFSRKNPNLHLDVTKTPPKMETTRQRSQSGSQAQNKERQTDSNGNTTESDRAMRHSWASDSKGQMANSSAAFNWRKDSDPSPGSASSKSRSSPKPGSGSSTPKSAYDKQEQEFNLLQQSLLGQVEGSLSDLELEQELEPLPTPSSATQQFFLNLDSFQPKEFASDPEESSMLSMLQDNIHTEGWHVEFVDHAGKQMFVVRITPRNRHWTDLVLGVRGRVEEAGLRHFTLLNRDTGESIVPYDPIDSSLKGVKILEVPEERFDCCWCENHQIHTS